MIKNFKITIEYDGTGYHGWQRQKEDRSIQGEIENALRTMTGKKVTVIGSGRTDAGVHAFGQVANFHCDTNLDSDAFLKGLNSLTSADIVIRVCERVESSFHARYHAKSKTYHYKILNRFVPPAIGRQYAWYIRKKLNIEAMQGAITHIIGSHDFKAFEATGSPRAHTTRRVISAKLMVAHEDRLTFEIQADGFLRFMVRNIVGTLVNVGLGTISAEDFKHILESKDRSQAGATAPAHGLFLMAVQY